MTVDADAMDQHVATRVRTARVVAGLSQAEVAAGLRVSPQLVAKMETGASRISAGRLHAIAEFLQVPHAFFFQGMGEPVPAESARPLSISAAARELLALWPSMPANRKRFIMKLARKGGGDG